MPLGSGDPLHLPPRRRVVPNSAKTRSLSKETLSAAVEVPTGYSVASNVTPLTMSSCARSRRFLSAREPADAGDDQVSELAQVFDWDPQAGVPWRSMENSGPPAGPEAAPPSELLGLRTRLELRVQALER